MDDHEPNPEDKWYQDVEDGGNVEKSFNPCPTIPMSKEEFEEWCRPWKNILVVKVLGKRVTFTRGRLHTCAYGRALDDHWPLAHCSEMETVLPIRFHRSEKNCCLDLDHESSD
ncbi:hypothetical protein AHAS_Ahas04G0070400 [Arachis hypogaea]